MLELEEDNDGFTTPNPWKRVAIGSPKKDGDEMKREKGGVESIARLKTDLRCFYL